MKAESEKALIELLDDNTSESRRAQLISQLNEDSEAIETYDLILNTDAFVGKLPLEDPSPAFNEGVLLGYRRLKTREANNRLMTYFVGIAAAVIAIILTFSGNTTTTLPSQATPIWQQISNRLPDLSITLNNDGLIQLALVLNAGLLIVLIEKIVSKKKVLGIHSFI